MMPRTATVPPMKPSAALTKFMAEKPARERARRYVQKPKKVTAQSAKVAQYWAGERSVSASRTFEIGANKAYASGVLRLAVTDASGWATSISGDNEKTAVITSAAVITSGHR
jgi:hypothetical protein